MTHEILGRALAVVIMAAGIIASCGPAASLYGRAKRRNWAAKILLVIVGVSGIFLTEGLIWPLLARYGAKQPTDILIAWPAAAIIWAMLFALIANLPQAKKEVKQFLLGR